MNFFMVALGGLFGAVCRYGVSLFLAEKSAPFPLATFFVNLTGCFLMGFIVEMLQLKAAVSPEVKLFLTTGFLGAFTTFSTFGLDIVTLINRQAFGTAFLYVLLSVILGVTGVFIGIAVARLC